MSLINHEELIKQLALGEVIKKKLVGLHSYFYTLNFIPLISKLETSTG